MAKKGGDILDEKLVKDGQRANLITHLTIYFRITAEQARILVARLDDCAGAGLFPPALWARF